MHNHKDGGYKRILWMMVPCLLLLGVLFLGGEKLSSSGYFWLILIGFCVIPHIWMMLKGGGRSGDDDDGEDKPDAALKGQPDLNKKDKHGGCCH